MKNTRKKMPKAKIRQKKIVKKRDRKPGEVLTKTFAIRSHCLRCAGGSRKEVAECPIRECWLWPFRFGNNWKKNKQGISKDVYEENNHGDSFQGEIDYDS